MKRTARWLAGPVLVLLAVALAAATAGPAESTDQARILLPGMPGVVTPAGEPATPA